MSLLQRAEQWPKQWMAEGEKKGRRLGQAKTLKIQAQHRWWCQASLPTGKAVLC